MNELDFSVIRGGPLYRLRKATGFVPERGVGLAKRLVFLIAFAWLPVVVGAILEGLAFEGGRTPDPLLRHYGVHGRLLVAVPLFLLAEVLMEKVVPLVMQHFETTGLVDSANRPAFLQVLRDTEKVRDSIWGLVVVLGFTLLSVLAPFYNVDADELSWTGAGGLGFAGNWYVWVARPVFVLALSAWVWRLVTVWYLQARLSKVDLRLVPTHPDRAGGLAFMTYLITPVAPVVFGTSAVFAGRWAHEVKFHGVHVHDLQPVMIAYVVLVVALFVGPALVISRNLARFRRTSLMQYGALIGGLGRTVHRKWILKEIPQDTAILDAPEIGPVADGVALYDAIARMRPVVVNKASVLPVAIAAVLPLVPVLAIEIPLKDILKKLALTLA